MQLPDAHASYFDGVGRIHVPPADGADLLKEGVADLPAELGVLVQVGDVGLSEVDLGCILFLLLLLMLLLRLFGCLPVVNYLVYVFLLILGLLELLKHVRADRAHVELAEHFLHFLHLHLQLLSFLGQVSDKFIGLAFVDDRLVLDFLGLVSVPQGRESLLVVVGGWGNSTDHQGFRVSSQGILQDTSQAGIPVGDDGVLSLAQSLIGQGGDDQA